MDKGPEKEATRFKTRSEITAGEIKEHIEENFEHAHSLLSEQDLSGAIHVLLNTQFQVLSLIGCHMHDVAALIQPIINALEDEDEDTEH